MFLRSTVYVYVTARESARRRALLSREAGSVDWDDPSSHPSPGFSSAKFVQMSNTFYPRKGSDGGRRTALCINKVSLRGKILVDRLRKRKDTAFIAEDVSLIRTGELRRNPLLRRGFLSPEEFRVKWKEEKKRKKKDRNFSQTEERGGHSYLQGVSLRAREGRDEGISRARNVLRVCGREAPK